MSETITIQYKIDTHGDEVVHRVVLPSGQILWFNEDPEDWITDTEVYAAVLAELGYEIEEIWPDDEA